MKGTVEDYTGIVKALYDPADGDGWIQLLTPLRGKIPIRESWNTDAILRFEGAAPSITAKSIGAHLAAGGNVGLTIPHGVVVADCDSATATEWLRGKLPELAPNGDFSDRVPQQQSRPGRVHFIMRLPDNVEDIIREGEGDTEDGRFRLLQAACITPAGRIDLRTCGKGQIVCEPSVHPSTGESYRWLKELPASLADVPEIPISVLRELLDCRTGTQTAREMVRGGSGDGGERTGPRLLSEAIPLMIPEGGIANRDGVVVGEGRNDNAYRTACALVNKLRDFDEVLAVMRLHTDKYHNPPLPDRELQSVVLSAYKSHGKNAPANANAYANAYDDDPLMNKPTNIPARNADGTLNHFSYADIQPRNVLWLWQDLIARRTITFFDGMPGTRKSTLMAKMAAMVTTGEPWPIHPFGKPSEVREPAGVVIISGEDSPDDAIAPRLLSCGADMSRVRGIAPEDYVDFATGDEVLRDAISAVNASIVVFDPISQFESSDSGVDMYRDGIARSTYATLAKTAEDTGVAILAIRHTRKQQGGDAIHAGGGSIALSAKARSVIIVAPDPDTGNPDQKYTSVLAIAKMNYADPDSELNGKGLRYCVKKDRNGDYTLSCVFDWAGLVEITANELMAPKKGKGSDYSAELKGMYDRFMQGLKMHTNGCVPVSFVKSEFPDVPRSVDNRLKEMLGLKATKVGTDWCWKLDETNRGADLVLPRGDRDEEQDEEPFM